MSNETCFDRKTQKPRLLSEQCSTCVGRPGNLMHLDPGRLQDLVRQNIDQGGPLICHQTLSYGDYPEFGGAVCRWFYDHYSPQCNYVRIMERLGGFTEVDLPSPE